MTPLHALPDLEPPKVKTAGKIPLRALIVEDNPDDVQFLVRALGQGGFDAVYRQVEDTEGMYRALEEEAWDVVFLDYHLPKFSAKGALGILRTLRLDLPCIVISGAVGEEAAVEVMRAGAHDFITKGNLSRLIPVLQRELSDAQERRALTRATDSLRQLGRLRDDFIDTVSHELKTPLTSILGYLKLLRGQSSGGLTDVQREFVGTAYLNAERLQTLVENLLDLSKLEVHNDALSLIQTAIGPILDRASGAVTGLITSKGLSFRVGAEPSGLLVRADVAKLNRVLLNLLSNALKFTQPGGRIALRAQAYGVGGRPGVLIQVEDTGTGIAPGDLEKVFEKFYQVDNTATRKVGGTGLGLAICQGLVEAHSGKIWAESRLGVGSTFNVFLPDQA